MELAEPLVTINEETGIFTLNNKFDNNKYDEKLIKKLSILYKFNKIFTIIILLIFPTKILILYSYNSYFLKNGFWK